MNLSGKKRIMVIGLVLGTVLIVISIAVHLVVLVLMYSERTEVRKKRFDYKYTEVSLSSNSTTQGFVTVPNILDSEQFISYTNDETGSTFIITNFGGSEFECEGTCHCQAESKRRSAANILSRGFYITLSAFTSAMALRIAKDTFQDQCVHHFSDVCEPSYVIAEVDGCENKKEEEAIEKVNYGIQSEELEKGEFDDFMCEGYCLEVDFQGPAPGSGKESDVSGGTSREEFQRVGFEHVGLCEGLQLKRIISAGRTAVRLGAHPVLGNVLRQRTDEMTVAIQFATSYLNDFCHKTSELKFEWFSDDHQKRFNRYVSTRLKSSDVSGEEKRMFAQRTKSRPFCIGFFTNYREEGLQIAAKNVKCVKRKK